MSPIVNFPKSSLGLRSDDDCRATRFRRGSHPGRSADAVRGTAARDLGACARRTTGSRAVETLSANLSRRKRNSHPGNCSGGRGTACSRGTACGRDCAKFAASAG